MSDKKWTVQLEEDPDTGDLLLPFPPDLLAQMGWDFGDVIRWDFDEESQTAILTKKP